MMELKDNKCNVATVVSAIVSALMGVFLYGITFYDILPECLANFMERIYSMWSIPNLLPFIVLAAIILGALAIITNRKGSTGIRIISIVLALIGIGGVLVFVFSFCGIT